MSGKIKRHKEYSKSNERIGNMLFLLSIASIFLSLITAVLVLKDFPRSLWICFCYAILPLVSLIFGIISRRKGFFGKKNIIVGAIIAFLQICWGISGLIPVPN